MSVFINEFVLFDDMTDDDIVDAKIIDLIASGAVSGEHAVLRRRIHSDLWKMTYQDTFNVVCIGEQSDRENPIAHAMFWGTDVCYNDDVPDEEEFKEHLGIHDWSTSLADQVAGQLIDYGVRVFVSEKGDEADGIENCSTLILHKRTLAQPGVANGVSELVSEINKRQAFVSFRTGATLRPVQVFIHEGDVASLEVLGKPSVPLRLV